MATIHASEMSVAVGTPHPRKMSAYVTPLVAATPPLPLPPPLPPPLPLPLPPPLIWYESKAPDA